MAFGFALALTALRQSLVLAFTPASLYSDGSQGAWYDNSDMSTLFQDFAGTIPAVLESPVGKQLDLSGRGNHRSQATSANRPLLSARYNLLTKTEQFDNAVWVKNAVTMTIPGTIIAPDATLTMNSAIPASSSGLHYWYELFTAGATSYTVSCVGKANGYSWLALGFGADASIDGAYFDLTNGSKGAVASGSTATITPLGDGLYRCSVSRTLAAGARAFQGEIHSSDGQGAWVANGTSGIYIWGADIRPTDQTITMPAYQRVDTSTVYDTVNFPRYIRYNGSNQFLSTASIDFTATAQMAVFAGVRKLSNVAGPIVEMSVNSGGNNGSFLLFCEGNPGAANNYYAAYRGTVISVAIAAPFVAPITNTVSVLGSISGSAVTVLVNGTQAAQNTATQGTGNFGNYPLYFGARAGTSNYCNGQEYQMIIVGKTLTTAQITSTETYVNSKTKAY